MTFFEIIYRQKEKFTKVSKAEKDGTNDDTSGADDSKKKTKSKK